MSARSTRNGSPVRAGTDEHIGDIALCRQKVVPKVGLEPTLPWGEPDFESGASASSATSARGMGE